MTALLLAPAALSFLALGAHFLRAGQLLLVALAVALLVLLFVRRRWAGRTAQVALLLGAVEWLRTAVTLVGVRMSMGLPYGRMVVILGAVAAVCALSALPLRAARARRWFEAPRGGGT